MLVQEYIINDIKPLSVTDKISDLQLRFNQLTYSHIPIADDNNYLGCISEADAMCFNAEASIRDFLYAAEGFFVSEDTQWLGVLESFAQHNCNILPVLNKSNLYLGYYELNDIMHLFNNTPFFAELGGILIVEKGLYDYSFSEISQIVESNNAKLLGAFISRMNADIVQITLKVSSMSLNDIIQTFRRYNYSIIYGNEDDTYIENLKERSGYLNKYLDI